MQHDLYLAHSANKAGIPEALREHLTLVAKRAAEYASIFDAGKVAHAAGILHDIGKYGSLFQQRLKGLEKGIDHWSPGAWISLNRTGYDPCSKAAIAFCVAGHHTGLPELSLLRKIGSPQTDQCDGLPLRWSENDPSSLLSRMTEDALQLPQICPLGQGPYKWDDKEKIANMLDVRMLFSALVDADFIETEAHFQCDQAGNKGYRMPGPVLEANSAYQALRRYIEKISARTRCSDKVRRVRDSLLESCLDSAYERPGLFTATAPTGSGKTLSLLAFALRHALIHGLRRIVVVIPYLTLIEQTASLYREVFKDILADEQMYVLEDHSLAGSSTPPPETQEECQAHLDHSSPSRDLLAQNWDAPIVITTSVQLLESLFAHRPSACRKLHRLAKSILLFDEVQTLSVPLTVPTLAALSHLAFNYGSTVIFSTATQPAFSHLDEKVRRFCAQGWNPKEIVKDKMHLFHALRRNAMHFLNATSAEVSWEKLSEKIAQLSQVLCIVNLKKHAKCLYELVSARISDGVFHLSTNMCPKHRQDVLKSVRERLESNQPCRLISTQCVEAGVDVDFPYVFRAWGPLEAMAQAAGRCNRNGLRKEGHVYVFMPVEEEYPDQSYQRAAAVARIVLADKLSSGNIPLDDISLVERYYQELYNLSESGKKDLLEAVARWDFPSVAKYYRLIPKETVNILVPYDQNLFDDLRHRARRRGLSRSWILAAQHHSIGLFKPARDSPIIPYLEPLMLADNTRSEDWFIYLETGHYSMEMGLIPPHSDDCLIA